MNKHEKIKKEFWALAKKLRAEFESAEAILKSYREPTTICAWCGDKVKQGGAEISHGICQNCEVDFTQKVGAFFEGEIPK